MQEREWQADIVIDRKIAKICIEQQFPTLKPITIQYVGAGWDNKIFMVNDQIIFRFPRRTIAVELIERENRLLKHLQSLVSLATPNPQYLGEPSSAYPYPFHGYHIIPGHSGGHAKLSTEERTQSIIPLTQFLKELHSIKKDQAIELGIQPQKSNRTDTTNMIDRLTERVDLIIKNNMTNLNQSVFNQEMEAINGIALPEDDIGLVHGDLYCNHILFNQGKLCGIIDWGDSGISHQAIDFGIIHCFYPEECHDMFFEHYGKVDPVAWQFARFFGLYIALTLIPYTHENGDSQLKKESIASIKRISPKLIS